MPPVDEEPARPREPAVWPPPVTWPPEPAPPAEPPPAEPPPESAAPPPGWPPPATPAGPPSWAPVTPPAAPADAWRGSLVMGVILVVIGAAFLVTRVVDLRVGGETWPLWIVVPGLVMFGASFLIGGRPGLGLAIPGAIIAVVGAVLWFQEANDLYATWAYAWALVAPGAVGLAMLAYGLYLGDRTLAADGARTMLVGVGLFVGFAMVFEGVFGLSGDRFGRLDEVLPVVAIAFGAVLVVLSLVVPDGARRHRAEG